MMYSTPRNVILTISSIISISDNISLSAMVDQVGDYSLTLSPMVGQ